MRRQIGAIFRRFDVVLTPTTAQPALPIGALDGLSGWQTDKAMTAACPYTWPWNVHGLARDQRARRADARLGCRSVRSCSGPANSEAQLIALAAQLETVERWHERRPP